MRLHGEDKTNTIHYIKFIPAFLIVCRIFVCVKWDESIFLRTREIKQFIDITAQFRESSILRAQLKMESWKPRTIISSIADVCQLLAKW